MLLFCIDFLRTKLWAESEGAPFDRHRSLTGLLIAYADVYCAAHNAVIAAEAMGLGTVYIGTVLGAITAIRQEFSLPQLVLPVVALCVGYPRRKPARIPKLGRAAAVHYEQYQEQTQAEIRSGYERKYGPISDDYFERTYQEILEIDAQGKKGSAEQVRRIMAKMEIANTAQFLFKLRYRPDRGANQALRDAIREAGFELD